MQLNFELITFCFFFPFSLRALYKKLAMFLYLRITAVTVQIDDFNLKRTIRTQQSLSNSPSTKSMEPAPATTEQHQENYWCRLVHIATSHRQPTQELGWRLVREM